MSKRIDYYLSLVSPWTYLGHQRLVDMAAEHDAEISIWPVDFSQIFPQTGGLPLPKRAPARQSYRMQELKRWREFLNIPLTLEPKYFPADDRLAAGIVIALREQGELAAAIRFAGAVLTAVWVQERNIADHDTLVAIAAENGLDGTALLTESQQQKYTAQIRQDSEAALERGVFGAPSFVVDKQLFWGQDRLDFVQRLLAS